MKFNRKQMSTNHFINIAPHLHAVVEHFSSVEVWRNWVDGGFRQVDAPVSGDHVVQVCLEPSRVGAASRRGPGDAIKTSRWRGGAVVVACRCVVFGRTGHVEALDLSDDCNSFIDNLKSSL